MAIQEHALTGGGWPLGPRDTCYQYFAPAHALYRKGHSNPIRELKGAPRIISFLNLPSALSDSPSSCKRHFPAD